MTQQQAAESPVGRTDYTARRSVPRRVVGALTDDQATIALHWMSARELAARSRCRMRSGC